jgi:hypothetical protein
MVGQLNTQADAFVIRPRESGIYVIRDAKNPRIGCVTLSLRRSAVQLMPLCFSWRLGG